MNETNAHKEDYLTMLRGIYAEARLRFREMAEPYIRTPADRKFMEALVLVIGEISPEEALAALIRGQETSLDPGETS